MRLIALVGRAGGCTHSKPVFATLLLKLELNATCGFVRVTFLSQRSIALGGLPAPFAET
jgi:hypothetical protein